MTVLIADDREPNRKLVRVILRSKGYATAEACNGQEALDWLEKVSEPTVALIDWDMPLLDGAEVCRQIRKRTNLPPLYLILLTVKDTKKDMAAGLQAGADSYLSKPFEHSELVARVKAGAELLQRAGP